MSGPLRLAVFDVDGTLIDSQDAIAGCTDRRAARCGEVYAFVHFCVAGDRVPAHAEAGGFPGPVYRCAQ